MRTKVKVKLRVGFFYSATYTVNKLSSRALQCRKWQLIDKSQWCCSANAAIYCTRYRTIGPATAASKITTPQSTTPGLHFVSIHQMVSREQGSTRMQLTTHLSTSKGRMKGGVVLVGWPAADGLPI